MTGWSRWRTAIGLLLDIRRNPDDTDAVLHFGVLVNAAAVRRLLDVLRASDAGRALLRDRPAIDGRAVDYAALAQLPAGTLGHEYARFLRERGLDPDVFQMPLNVPHPGAAYLAQRMRQTHDIWHVLTGFDTDPAGEIELQAFTYAQLGIPSALLLASLGTVRQLRQRHGNAPFRLVAAFVRGRRARPLIAFRWEEHWTDSVDQLRASLLERG